jgi:hypothetical protein
MHVGASVIIWIASGGDVQLVFWPWLVVGLLPSWILFFLYRNLRGQIGGKVEAFTREQTQST